MSRFLIYRKGAKYKEEIESMEVCKWCINNVCCNEKSEWLGANAFACNDKKYCDDFEKEDGIIEVIE